jgi:integrase/recombinase XerD
MPTGAHAQSCYRHGYQRASGQRSFCHVLTYTGCRLAEALALSADRVDLRASRLTFETLKKQNRGVYRTVPVPPDIVTMLDFVHNIRWA